MLYDRRRQVIAARGRPPIIRATGRWLLASWRDADAQDQDRRRWPEAFRR
jgi:hypothetical protein